jgi:hypothetical protein
VETGERQRVEVTFVTMTGSRESQNLNRNCETQGRDAVAIEVTMDQKCMEG